MTSGPLADPVAEARRLIEHAGAGGVVLRALGGVAIRLQAPGGEPRLTRQVKDIDLAAAKGASKHAVKVILEAGYLADEMFNALRGSRRLLFHDPDNGRHLDVFIGEFSMCHDIPLTARLHLDPLTVPLEELLLSKLQIFKLTSNDQGDIHNLLFHHDVTDSAGAGASGSASGSGASGSASGSGASGSASGSGASGSASGSGASGSASGSGASGSASGSGASGSAAGEASGQISGAFIAGLCAADWGLWRTCQLNIDRSIQHLDESALEPDERKVVSGRLETLRARIDAEPKGRKWRMRNQMGDRVRWYAEPEEEAPGT